MKSTELKKTLEQLKIWDGDIMTFYGIGMMNLELQEKRNEI